VVSARKLSRYYGKYASRTSGDTRGLLCRLSFNCENYLPFLVLLEIYIDMSSMVKDTWHSKITQY
jgi:hypothetical protein